MAPPPGSDGQQASGGQLHFFVMMAIMIAIFYVVLIRPQRRREQERREMLGKVSTGDQVMFGGGILGTISNVKMSKTGKHGHAKFTFNLNFPFTGQVTTEKISNLEIYCSCWVN